MSPTCWYNHLSHELDNEKIQNGRCYWAQNSQRQEEFRDKLGLNICLSKTHRCDSGHWNPLDEMIRQKHHKENCNHKAYSHTKDHNLPLISLLISKTSF
jgi:hypothetical protein